MMLTAEVARMVKSAHREGMRKQAHNSARARNLSEAEATILAKAAGDTDYLVAHMDGYSAFFVGNDARIVGLALSESDDWNGRDIPEQQTPDGAPMLEIDRRDWNAMLAILEGYGHQVCHTELPVGAAA